MIHQNASRVPVYRFGFNLSTNALRGCLGVFFFFTAILCGNHAFGQDPPTETVKAGVVSVHEKPSETAELVETISMGETVRVLHRAGDWTVIMLSDGRVGWVRQSLMDTPPPPAGEEETTKTAAAPSEAPETSESHDVLFQAELKVDSGRVRSAPNMEGALHFGLQKGDRVDVLAIEGDWYRVRRPEDGDLGWAHKGLFNKIDAPDSAPRSVAAPPVSPRPDFRATVKVTSGRVREYPSLEAPVTFGITQGEVVDVTDVRDDWYEIKLSSGRRGWAHESLFDRTAATTALLKGIWTETIADGSEKLVFELSEFQPPKTFAVNETEIPQVVSDFANTALADGLDREIPVEGHLIQKIQLVQNAPENGFVRVVADLNPKETYDVKQTYYKNTNHYVLTFVPVISE